MHLGRLQAVAVDGSGTAFDEFSIAPAAAVKEAFEYHKVEMPMSVAAGPMGKSKHLHIAELLLGTTSVTDKWRQAHGADPTQSDVTRVYNTYLMIQPVLLRHASALIPGAVATIDKLRGDGVKIGLTTGFTRKMLDIALAGPRMEGLSFDADVASDEVVNSRPHKDMVVKLMKKLGVEYPGLVLKVDDTVSGIAEGLAAGTWTCAVYATSTYMNMESLSHAKAMSRPYVNDRKLASYHRLWQSGAHYLVPSIADIPTVIDKINCRLASGELPPCTK